MFTPCRANGAHTETVEARTRPKAVSEQEMAISSAHASALGVSKAGASTYKMDEKQAKHPRIQPHSCPSIPHKDNKRKHSLQSCRQKCKNEQSNLIPISDISQFATPKTHDAAQARRQLPQCQEQQCVQKHNSPSDARRRTEFDSRRLPMAICILAAPAPIGSMRATITELEARSPNWLATIRHPKIRRKGSLSRIPTGHRKPALRYPEVVSDTGNRFARLVEIMARLRAPGGCPWDREQTFDSIKPYTLEETYEVFEAIDARDWRGLAEELGDYLLQAVFYAEMAAEQGHFTIDDCLDAINTKLIRRHPHVFADAEAETAGDVKRRWDEIKAEEKAERGQTPKALLDGVPRSQPAVSECQQITAKAAKVGFDWDNYGQVMGKLEEELKELEEIRLSGDKQKIEHEYGDVLATVVNLARFLNVDAEQALRLANRRFRSRFAYVEANAQLPGATLDEMEALWQEAKRQHAD